MLMKRIARSRALNTNYQYCLYSLHDIPTLSSLSLFLNVGFFFFHFLLAVELRGHQLLESLGFVHCCYVTKPNIYEQVTFFLPL